MPAVLSKQEIIQQLKSVSGELTGFCFSINKELFFQQPVAKWSVAQNIQHLIVSTNTTRLAFTLPKFAIRIYAGRPNRPSRTFDELVAKYTLKLSQGGKASGRYIPKLILPENDPEKMLNTFLNTMNRLDGCIQKKWADPQLDQFIAPHPLLGKITFRELCYFTIYHTLHHLNIIKERIKG